MKVRERLLRCMRLAPTDRVPVNYLVGRGALADEMLTYFGVKSHPELIAKLGIDGLDPWGWAMVEPLYRGPLGGTGEIQVQYLLAWGFDAAYATPMAGCDTVADLRRHRYPRPDDFDFAGFAGRCRDVAGLDGLSLFGPISVGFLHHVRMRGYDRTFQDVTDPDWMDCYQERVAAATLPFLEALLGASDGQLDLIHMDEDAGSNDRLLVSPATWRRYYKPTWKLACDLIRDHGVRIWMHSCGCCRDIIEDFIELGVDVLNPVPDYVAGNDHGELKSLYGSRVCFDGGVDQPRVMIGGTVDDVEDEVKRVIDVLAPGGGFMIQPSQGLTVDMPMENVGRFFEAALRHGGYP